MTKLREFYAQLERHDWHYQMSDDPGVYRAGAVVASQLRVTSTFGPKHKKLFDAYRAYINDGKPKPKRPR